MIKERIREFDIARVFAIFCMIAVHTEYAIYNYSNEVFATVFDYLGSPFAAPTFMFILGANIYLSRHNTPKELFVRGVKIFSIAILFNIICHALPFFILDYMNGTAGFAEDSLHWIFAVDILTFSGLAFMFFALVRWLKLNCWVTLGIGVALSLIGSALIKYCQIDFHDNVLLAAVTAPFVSTNIAGYFSFLSWIIFPCLGYAFIQVREKAKNLDKFYGILGGISLAIYGFMVYGSFTFAKAYPLVVFAEEYDYYYMFPYQMVGNCAFCLAWISIMYFLAKIIPHGVDNVINRLNKNLTEIYLVQWFIINYCLVLPFGAQLQVNEWQYILIFLGVIVLSDVVIILYKKYIDWSKK